MKNDRAGQEDFVSIVIPAYNEAERIRPSLTALIDFCEPRFGRYEIVCVDDGSVDTTWDLLKKAADHPSVIPLRLPKNRGKGYAVKHGMLNARGRFCFYTDADLPYRLDAFTEAMAAFHAGGCDMVGGIRETLGRRSGPASSRYRGVASRVFSALVRLLFELDADDTQCGFKGFTDRAARKIFSNLQVCGYAFDVEVFLLARTMALHICNLPVTLVKQAGSKIRLTRDPFFMLLDLIRLRLKK